MMLRLQGFIGLLLIVAGINFYEQDVRVVAGEGDEIGIRCGAAIEGDFNSGFVMTCNGVQRDAAGLVGVVAGRDDQAVIAAASF